MNRMKESVIQNSKRLADIEAFDEWRIVSTVIPRVTKKLEFRRNVLTYERQNSNFLVNLGITVETDQIEFMIKNTYDPNF